jgi:hypothetical protein
MEDGTGLVGWLTPLADQHKPDHDTRARAEAEAANVLLVLLDAERSARSSSAEGPRTRRQAPRQVEHHDGGVRRRAVSVYAPVVLCVCS